MRMTKFLMGTTRRYAAVRIAVLMYHDIVYDIVHIAGAARLGRPTGGSLRSRWRPLVRLGPRVDDHDSAGPSPSLGATVTSARACLDPRAKLHCPPLRRVALSRLTSSEPGLGPGARSF